MLELLEYLRANDFKTYIVSGGGSEFMRAFAEREFAYDRESYIGRLVRGLDAAAGRGWVVIDMKQDWKRVYPAAR